MRKFKITDTCGVHNLHGMPALLGGLLSILFAGISTRETYDQFNMNEADENSSLVEIFPKMGAGSDWTAGRQAGAQFYAMVVTLLFALVGGLLTGTMMQCLRTS